MATPYEMNIHSIMRETPMRKKIILISCIGAFVLVCFIAFWVISENITPEEIIETGDKYVAAKSGLNLRAGPDKSSKVIITIPFGAKVTIEKTEGDKIFLDESYGRWVNVKYGNKTGWIFSGFLCDFNPDTIIKVVADYYDKYNKETCNSTDEFSVCYEVSKVSIKNIIDNYIVLQIPRSDYEFNMIIDILWRYDSKQKNFFEESDIGLYTIINLFYLDNDKYPDLVVEHMWDGLEAIEIFLGSKKGFKNIFDWGDNCHRPPRELNIGSCEDMEFACEKISHKTDNKTIQYFRFNCDKRKVIKYKETLITKAEGYVLSIDWKNLTIIIKDYKDSENAILKIPERYNSYHKESFGGLYIEYLKKLKENNAVSFSYKIIDGKKIVTEIDGWLL